MAKVRDLQGFGPRFGIEAKVCQQPLRIGCDLFEARPEHLAPLTERGGGHSFQRFDIACGRRTCPWGEPDYGRSDFGFRRERFGRQRKQDTRV